MMRRISALVLAGGLVAGGMSVGSASAASRPGAMMTQTIMLHQVGNSKVTGTAKFTYNPSAKMTTVLLTVRGLKPGSIHPAHIHVGRCGGNGAVIYPFSVIKARSNGMGVATTKFRGTFQHKMWYINVHQGPGLAGKQFTVISCANVM